MAIIKKKKNSWKLFFNKNICAYSLPYC